MNGNASIWYKIKICNIKFSLDLYILKSSESKKLLWKLICVYWGLLIIIFYKTEKYWPNYTHRIKQMSLPDFGENLKIRNGYFKNWFKDFLQIHIMNSLLGTIPSFLIRENCQNSLLNWSVSGLGNRHLGVMALMVSLNTS